MSSSPTKSNEGFLAHAFSRRPAGPARVTSTDIGPGRIASLDAKKEKSEEKVGLLSSKPTPAKPGLWSYLDTPAFLYFSIILFLLTLALAIYSILH